MLLDIFSCALHKYVSCEYESMRPDPQKIGVPISKFAPQENEDFCDGEFPQTDNYKIMKVYDKTKNLNKSM